MDSSITKDIERHAFLSAGKGEEISCCPFTQKGEGLQRTIWESEFKRAKRYMGLTNQTN